MTLEIGRKSTLLFSSTSSMWLSTSLTKAVLAWIRGKIFIVFFSTLPDELSNVRSCPWKKINLTNCIMNTICFQTYTRLHKSCAEYFICGHFAEPTVMVDVYFIPIISTLFNQPPSWTLGQPSQQGQMHQWQICICVGFYICILFLLGSACPFRLVDPSVCQAWAWGYTG